MSHAAHRSTLLTVSLLTVCFLVPLRLYGQCSATNIYPPPGNTIVSPHQAIQLSDPAGQQTAKFDMYWGGALASLQYAGTEYLDQGSSFATGGLLQVAMHT